MAGTDSATPAPDAPLPGGDAGVSYRNFWGATAILLATLLVELALLQLFAIGTATGIYHPAPQLDVGSPRGFRDWLSIMQVVSATLTLPGGAAIVLSTWLMSRWLRMADQRADSAEQEAKKWHDEAVAAQASAASAQSQISVLKAENAALQDEVERRPRQRRRLRR